jgi:hypothetical protein
MTLWADVMNFPHRPYGLLAALVFGLTLLWASHGSPKLLFGTVGCAALAAGLFDARRP